MIKIDSIKAAIYFEEDQNSFVTRILASLGACKKIACSSEDEFNQAIQSAKNEFDSKEVLIFKPFLGRLFQVCPGTPDMICCNYRLINTGFNCLYNCAYCYLQIYLNSFGIQLFSNMERIFQEIDIFLESMDPELIYRIGTGEFTDSLMIDEHTAIGESLIAKFAPYKNIMLELKTKSNLVDHLLPLAQKGNAVIGWSVNTPHNITHYEEGAALLDERLEAAKKAAKAGYFVAFHFDPVILYEGWEADYRLVIRSLFAAVPADKIAWISMGGFRFVASFKDVLRKNFPDEKMTTGEFFPGKDLKYRYQWKIRKAIYTLLKDEIASHSKTLYSYMCMESHDMWEAVYNREFNSNEEFERDFSSKMKAFLKRNNKL